MALINFMPYSKLTILVITHSIDLSICSKQQGIKDPTFYLFDFMSEIDKDWSSNFLRTIDP